MLAESPASGWLCPRSQCVAYGRARASSPTGSRFRFAALSSRLLSILPFFPPIDTIRHHAPWPITPTYFAFLGRISPEKAVDQAIWIAKRSGIPLKIAAKVDAVDRDYFESEIRKLLAPPDVEYIGEIGDSEKSSFLSGAIALLAPIAWPEPFGLVLIEAMACGTPVIAFNRGSVPEIVENGLTGFIVERKEEAVAATDQLADGRWCRSR